MQWDIKIVFSNCCFLRSPAVQRKKGTHKQEREANQCRAVTRKITLPRFDSLDPVSLIFVRIDIEREHWFTFFFHSATGSGQQCCFNKFGNLMVGQPDAGSLDRVHPNAGLPVISHFFHDKVPYEDCCRNSKNCEKYFEKRPSDDGSRYQAPRPGNS